MQKNLLLTAEVPFEVEQGKTNNNMEGETNGTQDSGQANVREGNEVGKQGKNKLWVTPGSPNKEIAQNWPDNTLWNHVAQTNTSKGQCVNKWPQALISDFFHSYSDSLDHKPIRVD